MEHYFIAVLKDRYGIDVNKIERYKSLYRISSLQGEWIAKAYDSNEQITRQADMFDELKKKGFNKFPDIIKDKDGLSGFYIDKYCYMLMPYIEGNTAKYSNNKDIELVVKVLSSLHHAGGWLNDKIMLPTNKPIQDKFKNRLDLFKGIYNRLQYKKEKDIFENQIVIVGNELIKIAERALTNLDIVQLQHLRMEAFENKMVCHQDIASHNFIIDNNKSWIIDFDIAGYESQILDLHQLVNRIMIDKKWSIEQFIKIEEFYQFYRGIRSSEKKILRALSQFPNDFFREVVGAYYFPDKYKRRNILEVINRFVDNKDLYYYYLYNINKT